MKRIILFIILLLKIYYSNAQEPKLILPVGHTGDINSVIFSPDSKYILTASDDRTAKLWEAGSWKLLFDLQGHRGGINCANFSPDGKLIVTGSGDSTAGVWDATTGRAKFFLKAHSDNVILANFSPDGKLIVTGSLDSTAKIWETSTGKQLHSLGRNEALLNYANFSNKGKFIVTSSSLPFTYDSSVRLWEASTGKLLVDLKADYLSSPGMAMPYREVCITIDNVASFGNHTPLEKHTEIEQLICDQIIDSAQVSPNGKLIITALSDSSVKVWENSSGKLTLKYNFRANKTGVRSASFSNDGKFIVVLLQDHSAKIFEAFSGKLKVYLSRYSFPLDSANFSPDCKLMVTLANDSSVKVWETSTGKLLRYIKTRSKVVRPPNFSAKGNFLILALNDCTVQVLKAESGKLLYTLLILAPVDHADFTADERYMITQSNSHVAKVWQGSTGSLLDSLNEYATCTAVYSADEKYILTAKNNLRTSNNAGKNLLLAASGYTILNLIATAAPGAGYIVPPNGDTVKISEVNKGMPISNHKIQASGFAADFSPNGRYFAISNHKYAKVWTTSDGMFLSDLKGHTKLMYGTNFNPDGTYFVTLADSIAKIWEVSTGRLKYNLHDSLINHANFSKDGRYIITSSSFGSTKMWTSYSGQLIYNLDGESAQFSPDTKYIITSTRDSIKIWNSSSGNLVYKFGGRTAQFSPYGKYLAIGCLDSTLKIINLNTGEISGSIKGNSDFTVLDFSPNEKSFITSDNTDFAHIVRWEAATGKLLDSIKSLSTTSAKFSLDGKYISTRSNMLGTGLRILDASTGEVVSYLGEHGHLSSFSPDGRCVVYSTGLIISDIFDTSAARLHLPSYSGAISSASFSADGKYIAASILKDGYLSSVNIYEASTARLIHSLADDGGFNSADFSPDGKYIVTTGGDNSLKIWNVTTGKLVYTLIGIDSVNYLSRVASGYYMCTPDASKLLHYVTKDRKIITFEQLDIKFNRPDKVLEEMGSQDIALIESYRHAYYKRIKKLNVDTSSFQAGYSVPEADFANRDSIALEQENEKLSLRIHGIDSIYTLDRFNIWINEVPVFGFAGVDINQRKRRSIDTSISISLSQGRNFIETSITNVNGTESYRMPLVVRYAPIPLKKERTYFIGIGINNFQDSTQNLNWSVKDIRDLSLKLKEKYVNDFEIDTLFNQNVTVANVRNLKKKLEGSSINDKVIIAYSGHGLLSKDYDYYLSTYNINFKKPEQYGLAYDELEHLLDNIPARKKLMLIDACQSGEVDKEEMMKYREVQKELDSMGITKGAVLVSADSSKVGMKNSFELMRELFVNVGKSTGATIISAAAGTQFALERNNLKNGVFTYSILEYMAEHEHATINEIKRFVNRRVTELTGGLQVPTARNENIELNWEAW